MDLRENVELTPSRGSDKFAVPSLPIVRPFALAPKARTPQTPPNKRKSGLGGADNTGVGVSEIEETPETKRTVDLVEATPVKSKLGARFEQRSDQVSLAGHDSEDNIYSALGWE